MRSGKCTEFFSRKGGLIFSLAASLGVIATAGLSIHAVPKAVRLLTGSDEVKTKEVLTKTWTCFIPSAVAGVASIAFIFTAHSFDKRHQAAVSAAFLAVSSAYKAYREKVKEIHGEKADADILTSIATEPCSDVYISGDSISGSNTLSLKETIEPDITRTFYDCFSRRYFETSLSHVIEAEYHLNRNFVLGGSPSLNDFYAFLGLSDFDGGDELSWDKYCDDSIFWIDFNHRMVTLDDGMECCLIEMPFEPIPYTED